MAIRILNQREVTRLLPMPACIDVMAATLSALSEGKAQLPLRTVLRLREGKGFFGTMPAELETPDTLGAKIISVFPGNEGSGLDSHQGMVLLFDTRTGAPSAVLDAASITAIRTAAVSGVATRVLARDDAGDLAILGSGVQARTHLEAIGLVRTLRRVRVWSRHPENARGFSEWARAHHACAVEIASSAEGAVRGADLVCTVTGSSIPVLQGDWIGEGTHVNAIGSSSPRARELDAEAVRRSRLFVDRKESALNEAGDFLLARGEGDDHRFPHSGRAGGCPARPDSGPDRAGRYHPVQIPGARDRGSGCRRPGAPQGARGKRRHGDRAGWPQGPRVNRARVNPFFEPSAAPPLDRSAVRRFHRSLPGYEPTPLRTLPGLALALGLGGVQVKDESGRFGLKAFKGLGASWALHRLLEGRTAPVTVATATDGNHGRALAWAAARAGCRAVVFIPAHSAPARIESIRREGARVELVEGSYDDTVRQCAAESAAHGWEIVADTGYEGYLEVPHWIAEGYATLFAEVEEQRAGNQWPHPQVVFIQAGVGGLLHAAIDHYRTREPQPVLVSVEPVEADALFASIDSPDGQPVMSAGRQDSIMAGLNCGEVSLAAWPAIRGGVELFLAIEDRFAEAAMRRLARPEPGDLSIEAGESGAAGLAGLLAVIEAPELLGARRFLELGPGTQVLVLNTEGATDPVGYRRVLAS